MSECTHAKIYNAEDSHLQVESASCPKIPTEFMDIVELINCEVRKKVNHTSCSDCEESWLEDVVITDFLAILRNSTQARFIL